MAFLFSLQTKLPPRPDVTRGDPLTSQQWSKHMDKDGKIINVEEVKDQIFRGVSTVKRKIFTSFNFHGISRSVSVRDN